MTRTQNCWWEMYNGEHTRVFIEYGDAVGALLDIGGFSFDAIRGVRRLYQDNVARLEFSCSHHLVFHDAMYVAFPNELI